MTDRHTLIIPTYNRPALLKRLVLYYCSRARFVNLLILDSSAPAVAEENARALLPVGRSVRHVMFTQDLPPTEKFARGLELVHTPFASFCGDDDIVFPEALREAVTFLAGHPGYVCAHGLYLNFRLAEQYVHLRGEYAGFSNEAGHPGARIFRLFQKYESLFYAVFRTQDLREIFSVVPTIPTIHFQELFQSVAALIKGNVRRFPAIYAARQTIAPAEPARDKWQTYYWFAENAAEVIEHYRGYCGEVWRFYERHAATPQLGKEAFYRSLDLAHAVYFAAGCPPEYFHSILQAYWPEDRYLKFGRLEMLRKADKPRVLNWRGSPDGDPEVDLFDRLRTPSGLPRWAAARALAALWYFACSVPGLARLNHDAQKGGRTPWKCRLSPRFLWLAAVPEFRKAWIELCCYLDQY